MLKFLFFWSRSLPNDEVCIFFLLDIVFKVFILSFTQYNFQDCICICLKVGNWPP
ncbi:unnamed protein product [Coffea canephora]|uniref:Uncharacterized protein n=1 Tax=Coffea canephora TaxID=49390 RepID=A0A068V5X6_COFCA|nr:unnamed protein product [Coffea canephora]